MCAPKSEPPLPMIYRVTGNRSSINQLLTGRLGHNRVERRDARITSSVCGTFAGPRCLPSQLLDYILHQSAGRLNGTNDRIALFTAHISESSRGSHHHFFGILAHYEIEQTRLYRFISRSGFEKARPGSSLFRVDYGQSVPV